MALNLAIKFGILCQLYNKIYKELDTAPICDANICWRFGFYDK